MRSCIFSALRNKIQHSMLYSKANKSIPLCLDLPLILLQKSKTSSSSSSPSISSTSSKDQSQSLNARSSNLQQEGLMFNECHTSIKDLKVPFAVSLNLFNQKTVLSRWVCSFAYHDYEDSVSIHVS